MHKTLQEKLVCPRCHGELSWQISSETPIRVESADLDCKACGVSYEVRDGIGNFLLPDHESRDLWREAESGLTRYLREHPRVRTRLLEGPVDRLSPADLFFRAMALEERQAFKEAREVESLARERLYTEAYIDCRESQTGFVIDKISSAKDTVVDLASGRGYLVERILTATDRHVVATDVSPIVLRRNRVRLEAAGLYARSSLLAFDARRTPFRTRSVETLTSNLGLPNIAEPEGLLEELRRIVSGLFLCITHFYPEGDNVNAAALREAGLSSLVHRRMTLARFRAAGWSVEVRNECRGVARPTPPSDLFEGASIDAFPVQETSLTWCVLEAR